MLNLAVSWREHPNYWRPLVSPILVRPVREQLEHDRVIRLLQAKFRRRFDSAINPGGEQNTPVGSGPSALFPDVVLLAQGRGRRLQTVIEVETGESVNHLEALSQWAHMARLRVPFHLYVPSSMVDVARRLCEDNQIVVNEIWSFHTVGDEVRFTLVHKMREPAPARARPRPAARPVTRRKTGVSSGRTASPGKRSSRKAAPARRTARKAGSTQKRK